MGKGKDERIVLRKQDKIGANDAEEDSAFLAECFVDTGDLELLRDCSRPERLVIGRTGAGKTALLLRLRDTEQRCIEVRPENLALSYISNSTVLQFFETIGVKLDPFYKLIWRHAFAIELLRNRFGLEETQASVGLGERIKALFKPGSYSEAIKYLEKWGPHFWQETEQRVKEITKKVETSLTDSLTGKFPVADLSYGAAHSLSEESKQEIINRAQKVVNDAHVPQLNQILDLVRDVLDDKQKRYFIVVDRLDESWVDEQLRNKLIMALIETVKDFRRIRNAKIVLSLRLDLIQRVFKQARTAGFQEEKIESLYLRLHWKRKDLVELVDTRVQHLFRDRYSKNKKLTARDLLGQSRRGTDPLDYLLDRTFLRPRDVISFFNECISVAGGRAKISLSDVKEAEAIYSKGRFRSVADEWHADFPNLSVFAKALLNGVQQQDTIGSVANDDQVQEHCMSLVTRELPQDDLLSVCKAVAESKRPARDMLMAAWSIFYRVGIVGLKPETTESFAWHADTGRRFDATELDNDTLYRVHPMFVRTLGVKPAGDA